MQKIEKLTLFIWLMLASGAGMALYTGANDADTTAGGGPYIRVAYSLLYIFFFGMVAMNFRAITAIVLRERWLMAIWLLVLTSTLWSIEPSQTLRRAIALLGTTLVGLYVATKFEPKEQIRIVGAVVAIAGLASFAVAILYPKAGVAGAGEWKGVFHHKNMLGHTMALGVFCFSFMAIGEKKRRILSIVMALFCGFMLIMSQSVTALGVCLVMLVVLKFRRIFQVPVRTFVIFGLAFLAIAVPATIWFMANLDSFLLAIGKDPTLTGRIPLWQAVVGEIAKRPILGYGYQAFWYSPEGDRVHTFLNWLPMHSHDGYLETTLALGFVGMTVLILGWLTNVMRGFRVYRSAETIEEFWPLFFLIFAAFDNIAESWMIMVNSLVWMLYVANTYWITRTAMEMQRVTVDDPEPDQLAEANFPALGSIHS